MKRLLSFAAAATVLFAACQKTEVVYDSASTVTGTASTKSRSAIKASRTIPMTFSTAKTAAITLQTAPLRPTAAAVPQQLPRSERAANLPATPC